MGLKWSRAGSQDLESVQRYVGRDDPDAVIEMVLEIIRRVEVLAEHPGIGRPGAPLCNDIPPVTRVDVYFVQHQRGNGREGRAVSGKRVSWRLIVLRATADARSPACRPRPHSMSFSCRPEIPSPRKLLLGQPELVPPLVAQRAALAVALRGFHGVAGVGMAPSPRAS